MKGLAMKRLTFAFSLLCLAGAIHAQEMKPGLWEVTTTMKMQGMQMPGGKFNHCYTAKDLADGKQYQGDTNSKCTISNMKSGGGNISYDMSCQIEGGKMTGSVKGSMSPTAYSFDQNMRMTPDQGMGEMLSIIKGRRLGDCK
jgi:hypothetical protein